MKTILTTERFIVRRYTEADLDDFVDLLMDPEVKVYLPQHPHEKWRQIFTDNLAACEAYPEIGRWGVEHKASGKLVGNCMLNTPREGLTGYEVGYAFEKPFWGTGAGTEVVNGIVGYAFDKPYIDKLYAVTSYANVPSQKVLTNAGFAQTATFVLGEMELPLFTLVK